MVEISWYLRETHHLLLQGRRWGTLKMETPVISTRIHGNIQEILFLLCPSSHNSKGPRWVARWPLVWLPAKVIEGITHINVIQQCCQLPRLHSVGNRRVSMDIQHYGINSRKTRTLRKIWTSVISSTTNPTWTDLGSNLSLHGDMLANNHLSHGTAQQINEK